MRLKDWLTKRKMTQAAFAGAVGRSTATVSRIVNGVDRPNWATLDAIHKATDGEVGPADFMGGADG